MVGRNAPCPCGSGKKYKKCCWAKDRKARTEQKAVEINSERPETAVHEEIEADLTPASDLRPAPAVDPLMERINAFWDKFMETPYEKQWAMVTEMLAAEPELCDGEMVFEITSTLFEKAVAAGETARYKQLLDQLEEAVPEAYAEKLAYILDQRIQIALMEGDEAGVEHCFYQFSPLTGDKLDIYYWVISALAYYGKQEILYQGMRQAASYAVEDGGLIDWAYSEFTDKLADLEIFRLLDKNPDLTLDDPTLQQRFSEYEFMVVAEEMSVVLNYRTGRKTPAWTLADFEVTEGETEDLAKENLDYLLAAFTHYAHVEEGISRTKVEMAHDELSRYLAQRREGELDEFQHPLCPDAKTLDQFLTQLVGFLSFQYYEAFALFELVPVWLRFLAKYELLDEETRQKTVQELSYIRGHLIQATENNISDPAVLENLTDWPYEPRSVITS